MNKKHLIGYPVTFVVAMMMTAAGDGSTSASPVPTVTVTPPTVYETKTVPAPAATVTVAPKAAPAPAPKPKPVAATMDEGLWVIGEDAPAGRYKTTGPQEGPMPMCYYAFVKGEGADADIITNEIVKGRATVIVKAGQVFDTSGCEPWVKVG